VRFQLDAENENHDPLDVEVKQLRETNHLVEEFMLLANITVRAVTAIVGAMPCFPAVLTCILSFLLLSAAGGQEDIRDVPRDRSAAPPPTSSAGQVRQPRPMGKEYASAQLWTLLLSIGYCPTSMDGMTSNLHAVRRRMLLLCSDWRGARHVVVQGSR
jgi:hypothetical protein